MASNAIVPGGGFDKLGDTGKEWKEIHAEEVDAVKIGDGTNTETAANIIANVDKIKNIDKAALAAISGNGINHNGIYRSKNLGTFSTTAEFEKFLSEHKVSTGEFKDLFLGDYFTAPTNFTGITDTATRATSDGATVVSPAIIEQQSSVEYEIVAFNYYLNKGDTPMTANHLVLKPRRPLVHAPMNGLSGTTNVTAGGYYNSYMNKTLMPRINSVLQGFFGSHLLTRRALLSNNVNDTLASMCGAGRMGASVDWAWYDVKACLPSEIAIYGSNVFSSSFYDIGEEDNQLPIYHFKNHTANGRYSCWLRSVSFSGIFAGSYGYGFPYHWLASRRLGVSPLILVG